MEANQSSSALAPAGSMPLTFAATSWLSWLLATIGIFTVSKLRFTGPQADSAARARAAEVKRNVIFSRSEEHTSELQSLMRISYAVFCLKKKTPHDKVTTHG